MAASPAFRGGQAAADAALADLDVRGYASRRNDVLPGDRRGATRLSPWIRHGLLTLPRVWHAVADAPARDRTKFRNELSWQEYTRHLYAQVGRSLRAPLRFEPGRATGDWDRAPWPDEMACVAASIGELERDGWMVNQARMWMASQYVVRGHGDWWEGEQHFFRHLLDGSRFANGLGWQWTTGMATGRTYGFSRSQVMKRAPELCADCELAHDCPIEEWPDLDRASRRESRPATIGGERTPGWTAGPDQVLRRRPPDVVWLTAESLGDDDPALAAHPDLPVVFVFDAPLLARLRLSGKRLVFLAECLADLASRRDLVVHVGAPAEVLAEHDPAVTFTPVPGWRALSRRLQPAVIHPWPWLRRPDGGSVQSFSAWDRRHDDPEPPRQPRLDLGGGLD
ncbi:deoxyribodipyrimidine photolyase [Nitriliruptoria bacterium AS10]|nr:deoxyribodipyrimidine photolyase [Salsipaludibacter albus]